MGALTLRLDDVDHNLLRLLTLVHHKSANQIVIELLHAEFDRALPGKRNSTHRPGSAGEHMRQMLGLPPLADDPDADRHLDTALSHAEAAADEFYNDRDHGDGQAQVAA